MLVTKKDHYMDECPNLLQHYILKVIDVRPDGICGYKEIIALIGQGEESWALIHQDSIWELQT